MKRLGRRIGPWLTVTLLAVEIGLVWTGILSLLNAVIIIVLVELMLILIAISRGVVAVRAFRTGRADGRDRWVAAEDGLAELVPRRLAHVLLIEARVWVCLVLWLTRSRPRGRTFGYGASMRSLMRIALGLVIVEGAVVEAVLAAVLGRANPWVWVALGLHVYGLILIAGFLGSLSVLPHEIGRGLLVLHDSVFATVSVPLEAIESARVRRHGHFGRSGFKVEDGTGLLAYGDATVRIALVPGATVHVGSRRAPAPRYIDVTTDDPETLVRALNEAR